MAEKDDWESFAASGKILDYLEYKGCFDRWTNQSDTGMEPGAEKDVLFASEHDRKKEDRERLES